MNVTTPIARLLARLTMAIRALLRNRSSSPSRLAPLYAYAKALFCELSGEKAYYLECGHYGSLNWNVYIWGTALYTRISTQECESGFSGGTLSTSGLCGSCFFKRMVQQSIRCALCGRGILRDEPCTLYPFTVADPLIPEGAIGHWNDCIVGCLNIECCVDPPSYACGHWAGTYFVPDETSPLVNPSLRPPSSSPS